MLSLSLFLSLSLATKSFARRRSSSLVVVFSRFCLYCEASAVCNPMQSAKKIFPGKKNTVRVSLFIFSFYFWDLFWRRNELERKKERKKERVEHYDHTHPRVRRKRDTQRERMDCRVQTEAGRRFRKTRLCERFLRRGEEIYWGSRVVVRGPGRVSFDAILLYLHIYTLLHEKQPNAFQNRFLDDFITSSVVSAPPRRKLFFDALHIYIYIERERDSRDFCALRLYYYHHHHHHRFIEAARGASSMDFDVPQSSSSGTLILKCSMIASIFRSSFSVR